MQGYLGWMKLYKDNLLSLEIGRKLVLSILVAVERCDGLCLWRMPADAENCRRRSGDSGSIEGEDCRDRAG